MIKILVLPPENAVILCFCPPTLSSNYDTYLDLALNLFPQTALFSGVKR